MKFYTTFIFTGIVICLGSLYSNVDKKQYFTNPIINGGADPWLLQHEQVYYLSESDGNQSIFIAASPTITGLSTATKKKVFDFATLPDSLVKYATWGPHLNNIQGQWYIYFCAQSYNDPKFKHQRMWVIKSTTKSPYGPYQYVGEVLDSGDTEWAIDGSVIQRKNGDLYFVWSGIDNLDLLHQKTFIAKMISPTKVDRTTITNISQPTKEWEISERPIQEGQRPLIVDKDGKTIIMYSANASWTDEYCLGSLTNTDGDYLNSSSWVKSEKPLLQKTDKVFGPGGASYVKSVDKKEDWIIFHTAREKGSGWNRVIHTQPFTWNKEGNPVFGEPIPRDIKIKVPSGENYQHE